MSNKETMLAGRMAERALRQLERAEKFMLDAEEDTTEFDADMIAAKASVNDLLDKVEQRLPNNSLTLRRRARD